MKEFGKIKCTIWGSRKYKALSDKHKLFYLYLHTNTRVNSCGCYYSPIGYMTVDLKWKEADILDAIKACEDTNLIRYSLDEDTVYITNFFSVNAPNNPKHAIKIISDIEAIPYPEFAAACAQDLKQFLENSGWKIEQNILYRIDTLSIPYQHIDIDVDIDVDNKKNIGEDEKPKKPKRKKSKALAVNIDTLSIDHISEWLSQKRANGKYLTIDEYELLEMFKDYCKSKNPNYKDYVAAFRNSFKWKNAPRKGKTNGQSHSERLDAATQRAIDFFEHLDESEENPDSVVDPAII